MKASNYVSFNKEMFFDKYSINILSSYSIRSSQLVNNVVEPSYEIKVSVLESSGNQQALSDFGFYGYGTP